MGCLHLVRRSMTLRRLSVLVAYFQAQLLLIFNTNGGGEAQVTKPPWVPWTQNWGGKSAGGWKTWTTRPPWKSYGDKSADSGGGYKSWPTKSPGGWKQYGDNRGSGQSGGWKSWGTKSPGGWKPYGDKSNDRPPGGWKPYGERSGSGYQPYGDRSSGGSGGSYQPYGDKSRGGYQPYERKSSGSSGGGYQPQGGRPGSGSGAGYQPYGDRSGGNSGGGSYQPQGGRPGSGSGAGYQPYGDRSGGSSGGGSYQPQGGRPGSGSGAGYQPYGDRSGGSSGGGYQPYGKRPGSGSGSGYQPYGDRFGGGSGGRYQPYGDRSGGGPGSGYQPYGDRSGSGSGTGWKQTYSKNSWTKAPWKAYSTKISTTTRLTTTVARDPGDPKVKSAFEKAGIVPNIIPKAPLRELKVKWVDTVISFGNKIKPNITRLAPTFVRWPIDEANHLHTLIMIDPDVPSRQDPWKGEWQHWIVVNIPWGRIWAGEELTEYRGIKECHGLDIHRYIFLMYHQPNNEHIHFTEPRLKLPPYDMERSHFSARKFAMKYKLGDPVAGNFFTAKWEPYEDILHPYSPFHNFTIHEKDVMNEFEHRFTMAHVDYAKNHTDHILEFTTVEPEDFDMAEHIRNLG
ncbi:unnamed protein product [Bemisia tabaci]|uniref:Uncharacterized protein n=1 Tax=Bemisia tabaci TaxID=7038 RepID=A0A9P0A6F5_BEMTA|nr:unnamed protein product [Bemisia tabaci]